MYLLNPYKFKHFYKNKYLLSPLTGRRRYSLSYNYYYKCLWFRTPKVGSRTINQHFIENTPDKMYIYGSAVSYDPDDFADWFKFSFVREPVARLVSCWKNKVVESNMFEFDEGMYEKMKVFEFFLTWVEAQDIDTAEEHLQSQHMLIDHQNLNFLGKLESFESDLQTVAEKIGMPLKNIHKKNQSTNQKIELSEEISNRIKKIYAKDFELFYPELI